MKERIYPAPKSDHKRLAHQGVTLSEMKGLSERFFAVLRMTRRMGHSVKCTNVLRFDLAFFLSFGLWTLGAK